MKIRPALLKKINEAREGLLKDKRAAEKRLLRYLVVLQWLTKGKPDSFIIRKFQGWMTLPVSHTRDDEDGFHYLHISEFPDETEDIVVDVQAVTFEAGEAA